ncbi:MFS transporter [Halapricum hydrolyticum]|uniref:MFS transporter n=1 Tax=Halapricum hydrolyticum TaxID=2979991 RepID=A0AAE3ICL0_9EURY|nr:MFS transporter [Halapricum hydrolyticum]MCU4717197.1 MFS transporter [Halapricum hydrolyticum]MCU4726124.1 MFS transporter [Halapricum hydrolyticum]
MSEGTRLADADWKHRVLIWKFYLYRATLSEGFIYPIITLYLLARGLSDGDVGLVNGLFFAGVVGAEIPTGYVGDKIGRRNSLIISTLMMSVSMFAFTVSGSVLSFAVVYVFWGVALTFRSGTGSAYLYDTLDERLDTDEYAKITGRGGAAFLVTSAVTSVVGGVLYGIDHRIPFVAAGLVTGSGALVLLTMPETEQYAKGDGGSAFSARDAVETVREKFLAPELRRFIAYTALLLSVPELADLYIQPIVVAAGVPEQSLGLLYAGFMLVTAVASYNIDRVRRRVGIEGWFAAAPLLMAAVLAGMLVEPWLAIPGFIGMRIVKSLSYAFRGQHLNDHLPSLGRATVLSTASMVYGVSFIVFRIGGGSLAEAFGPKLAIVGLAVGVAVLTQLLRISGDIVVRPET